MTTLSVIVPVYNEQDSLTELATGILAHIPDDIELVQLLFVDDGSTDDSFDVLRALCKEHPVIGAIRLPVNRGKAEALDVGFRHAMGDIVITMDADLQDDPAEIPRFIDKLSEGYDLVSGWKGARQDPWHKTWPSKLFNAVVARVFKIPLRDFNCGFKAYRRRLVDQLSLYGELHRYIPVLAHSEGATMVDLPVQHHPRRHGQSKYGAGRLFKGFLDMLTVLVTTRFLKRPLHLFGGVGLIFAFAGGAILIYLAALWIGGLRPIGNRPLLFYGMAFLILGVQIVSLGIVAELFLKFNHRREKPVTSVMLGCVKEHSG